MKMTREFKLPKTEYLQQWFDKYKYLLLVCLVGLVLLLWPKGTDTKETNRTVSNTENADQVAALERQMEDLFSSISGVGQVKVLLTEEQGGEVFYQTEGEDEKTVLVNGSDRSESGLVRTTRPPAYRGAVVVCKGADSAAVRLAVVEAVANATGLGTDRITVLKMK